MIHLEFIQYAWYEPRHCSGKELLVVCRDGSCHIALFIEGEWLSTSGAQLFGSRAVLYWAKLPSLETVETNRGKEN